jgi:ElaB/YqjD/DUF883 family membrane-anchored ribosome-binding protein
MSDKPSSWQVDEAVGAAKTVVRDGVAAVSDAAGQAAGTLRDAANSVKQSATGSQTWRSGASLANEASQRVGDAADYVRETSSEDMWSDFVAAVKSKPVQSVAAAVVAGFILGRAARRV